MKTLQFKTVGLLFFAAATMLFSCKKENDTVTNTMTDEEAAEVISLAVSDNAQGLATQTTEITARANTYASVCGYSKDSTISRINTTGVYTWNYNFNWQWAVVCTGAIPTTMNANYKMKGTYSTARMSSNDSAVANLAVTNLVTGTQYTLNGTYTRNGSQTSKIRNQNSFTSKVTMNVSNLQVIKTTGQIASGSASVTITGDTSTGNTFSYGGTIVFNGAKTATITLNNGAVFNVSWA
jgi:transcriptional regulator with PAS, ATPase and Fis domain